MFSSKKTVVIALVITLLIISGIIYNFSSKNKSDNSPSSGSNNKITSQSFFPISSIEKIISNISNTITEVTSTEEGLVEDNPSIDRYTKISSIPVISMGTAALNGSTTIIFITKKGEIYYTQKEVPVLLIDTKLDNLTSATILSKSIVLQQKNNGGTKYYSLKFTDNNIKLLSLNSKTIKLLPSPNQNQVILINENNGGLDLYLTNEDLTQQIKIFSSPIKDLQFDWVSSNKVIVSTTPSSGINGTSYSLDINSSKITPLISNQPGLISKYNENLSRSIVSSSQNGNISTFIYANNNLIDLPLKTLASKCIWPTKEFYVICAVPKQISNIYTYPDSWYQGIISFNDSFWQINPETGESDILIEDLNDEIKDVFDITNLIKTGDKIYFINKLDGNLWIFNL